MEQIILLSICGFVSTTCAWLLLTSIIEEMKVITIRMKVHQFWLQVSADTQTNNRKKDMPKTTSEELDEIKAAYETQKQQIADLKAAAAAAGDTVPAEIKAKIDALAAEVEADQASPGAPAAADETQSTPSAS